MEDKGIFKYLLVIASTIVGVHSTHICLIKDMVSNCRYTVVCETYAGSASIPSCSSEPYVTFDVTKSTANILSAGFFGATNFDSRVRVIKANENNWNTVAESVFRYYAKVEQMDISNNKIKDIQNMAFKNLVYLEKLNLSRNEISYLGLSSLYTHDNKDSEIVSLDLSYNKLEILQSGLFKFMNKLKQLHLQYNKIHEIPDDVFMNLRNLIELNLHGNSLTAFNMTLINLKSLEKLDASQNNLVGLSGYELNRLTALVTANFSNNIIEIVDSNCFNQAFNLEVLDLNNNKIKSAIQNIMFLNNVKLRYLNFETNSITAIEDNAFKHNILSYLNLEKNNISGPITASTFAGLTNINELKLYGQNITSLDAGAFSGMTSIKLLNLSRNSILSVDSYCFGSVKNLSVLDLSHNTISDLSFVKNSLTNLTELSLRNNNLSKISSQQFANQTQLTRLDLSMNKIKTIERFSLPLENLQYLNLTGNSLTGTLEPDTFSPAKYLRYLDLSNFTLSKINNLTFVNMPVLARMNLSNNKIDNIDFNNFIGLNNLYSLDLSHNRLKILELSNELKNLKSLYLNNNNLKSLPKVNISSVLYLDLSHNSISNVSNAFFKQLNNLKALHMCYNKITVFNNHYTNLLTELTDLSLSHNELYNINLSFYKELISLDISNNRFNNIDKHFLKDMDNLQALDLSKNNITELLPGVFQNLKILKMLNLSSNHLSNLRYGSLRGLQRTEVLDLSRNNIVDLDVDTFHECGELKKLIIDYNHIKVVDFNRLLFITPKLSSLSLGGNPVSCKEIVRNMKSVNHTFFRSIEVTSIDKIYHEDNVHGIRCGNVSNSDTAKPGNEEASSQQQHSSTLVYFVWVTMIIFIIILVFIGFIYFKHYRGETSGNNFDSHRLRQSLEFRSSSMDSDLLS